MLSLIFEMYSFETKDIIELTNTFCNKMPGDFLFYENETALYVNYI